MIIGLLSESTDARVALIPETAKKLVTHKHQVQLESGAGDTAFYSDQLYQDAGATLTDRATLLASSDIILSINPPSQEELKQMKSGAAIISMFNARTNPEVIDQLKDLDILAFSLDQVPRTTIAQSMDVLSSMASMAGYKAVLVAANHLPGYFPMLMTAAGTIPPARVLILGAGVAGLQAIATARRLGATVEAFDVRSAAKEEVESLGAKFVEVEGAAEDQAAGGYAIQQTKEYQDKQKELIHQKAAKAHVIITTAQIPGRKAPLLVERRTVEAMQPGSVIVDLAAISGGNCEVTENDKVIQYHGVTVVGDSNLPAQMAQHASKLFSNNLFNFFQYVFKDGLDHIDFGNEVPASTCLSPFTAPVTEEAKPASDTDA